MQLNTRVFDKLTNLETDLPLNIQIVVDDVNDNIPQFQGPLQLTVPEQSKAGEEHELHIIFEYLIFCVDDNKLKDHVLHHRDSGGEGECHRQRPSRNSPCQDQI